VGLEAVGGVVAAGPMDQVAGADQHDLVAIPPRGGKSCTPALKRLPDIEFVSDLHAAILQRRFASPPRSNVTVLPAEPSAGYASLAI
jgi:hypothetical protein